MTVASDAIDALEIARSDRGSVDLFVVDLHLEERSIKSLLRALRSDERSRALPVLGLSSTIAPLSSDEARELGVDQIVTKPVGRSRLYNAAVRLVGGTPIETAANGNGEGQTSHPVTPPLRILVAEDNRINQEVVCVMLENLGHTVDLVANGLEAVEALSRASYDVVLMDCQMPELDGYGATRKLRQLEGPVAKVPVVALTANAMKGDRERCLDAGMDDFLSKPIEPAALRATLARWGRRSVTTASSTDARLDGRHGETEAAVDETVLERLRAYQTGSGPDIVTRLVRLFVETTRELLETARARSSHAMLPRSSGALTC